jgi:hypothetical protein
MACYAASLLCSRPPSCVFSTRLLVECCVRKCVCVCACVPVPALASTQHDGDNNRLQSRVGRGEGGYQLPSFLPFDLV